ncbi:unnamed protein product [Amoebophrya sp. A120]|nr:unnamed protein product [Amoebophrya sp. A120]|eukprot:GSA120T00002120001.1
MFDAPPSRCGTGNKSHGRTSMRYPSRRGSHASVGTTVIQVLLPAVLLFCARAVGVGLALARSGMIFDHARSFVSDPEEPASAKTTESSSSNNFWDQAIHEHADLDASEGAGAGDPLLSPRSPGASSGSTVPRLPTIFSGQELASIFGAAQQQDFRQRRYRLPGEDSSSGESTTSETEAAAVAKRRPRQPRAIVSGGSSSEQDDEEQVSYGAPRSRSTSWPLSALESQHAFGGGATASGQAVVGALGVKTDHVTPHRGREEFSSTAVAACEEDDSLLMPGLVRWSRQSSSEPTSPRAVAAIAGTEHDLWSTAAHWSIAKWLLKRHGRLAYFICGGGIPLSEPASPRSPRRNSRSRSGGSGGEREHSYLGAGTGLFDDCDGSSYVGQHGTSSTLGGAGGASASSSSSSTSMMPQVTSWEHEPAAVREGKSNTANKMSLVATPPATARPRTPNLLQSSLHGSLSLGDVNTAAPDGGNVGTGSSSTTSASASRAKSASKSKRSDSSSRSKNKSTGRRGPAVTPRSSGESSSSSQRHRHSASGNEPRTATLSWGGPPPSLPPSPAAVSPSGSDSEELVDSATFHNLAHLSPSGFRNSMAMLYPHRISPLHHLLNECAEDRVEPHNSPSDHAVSPHAATVLRAAANFMPSSPTDRELNFLTSAAAQGYCDRARTSVDDVTGRLADTVDDSTQELRADQGRRDETVPGISSQQPSDLDARRDAQVREDTGCTRSHQESNRLEPAGTSATEDLRVSAASLAELSERFESMLLCHNKPALFRKGVTTTHHALASCSLAHRGRALEMLWRSRLISTLLKRRHEQERERRRRKRRGAVARYPPAIKEDQNEDQSQEQAPGDAAPGDFLDYVTGASLNDSSLLGSWCRSVSDPTEEERLHILKAVHTLSLQERRKGKSGSKKENKGIKHYNSGPASEESSALVRANVVRPDAAARPGTVPDNNTTEMLRIVCQKNNALSSMPDERAQRQISTEDEDEELGLYDHNGEDFRRAVSAPCPAPTHDPILFDLDALEERAESEGGMLPSSSGDEADVESVVHASSLLAKTRSSTLTESNVESHMKNQGAQAQNQRPAGQPRRAFPPQALPLLVREHQPEASRLQSMEEGDRSSLAVHQGFHLRPSSAPQNRKNTAEITTVELKTRRDEEDQHDVEDCAKQERPSTCGGANSWPRSVFDSRFPAPLASSKQHLRSCADDSRGRENAPHGGREDVPRLNGFCSTSSSRGTSSSSRRPRSAGARTTTPTITSWPRYCNPSAPATTSSPYALSPFQAPSQEVPSSNHPAQTAPPREEVTVPLLRTTSSTTTTSSTSIRDRPLQTTSDMEPEVLSMDDPFLRTPTFSGPLLTEDADIKDHAVEHQVVGVENICARQTRAALEGGAALPSGDNTAGILEDLSLIRHLVEQNDPGAAADLAELEEQMVFDEMDSFVRQISESLCSDASRKEPDVVFVQHPLGLGRETRTSVIADTSAATISETERQDRRTSPEYAATGSSLSVSLGIMDSTDSLRSQASEGSVRRTLHRGKVISGTVKVRSTDQSPVVAPPPAPPITSGGTSGSTTNPEEHSTMPVSAVPTKTQLQNSLMLGVKRKAGASSAPTAFYFTLMNHFYQEARHHENAPTSRPASTEALGLRQGRLVLSILYFPEAVQSGMMLWAILERIGPRDSDFDFPGERSNFAEGITTRRTLLQAGDGEGSDSQSHCNSKMQLTVTGDLSRVDPGGVPGAAAASRSATGALDRRVSQFMLDFGRNTIEVVSGDSEATALAAFVLKVFKGSAFGPVQ